MGPKRAEEVAASTERVSNRRARFQVKPPIEQRLDILSLNARLSQRHYRLPQVNTNATAIAIDRIALDKVTRTIVAERRNDIQLVLTPVCANRRNRAATLNDCQP